MTIVSETPDPAVTNDTATDVMRIEAVSDMSLTTAVGPPASAVAGDSPNLRFDVPNDGPSDKPAGGPVRASVSSLLSLAPLAALSSRRRLLLILLGVLAFAVVACTQAPDPATTTVTLETRRTEAEATRAVDGASAEVSGVRLQGGTVTIER